MLSWAAGALAVAGLLAGLTGTWSPCGFSMVDTLSAGGRPFRRRTARACAAFALGAPLGGAITFGGLAALGSLLQGGRAALGLAAAIALGAAALDAFGVRIAPQLRRQVPESWRRRLPLPLAGFLYGILLGLGFTTYVLSFALPALAAISVAVADVPLGLVLGVAFGVGRALPIVVLAPLADRALGARAITAMAQRPRLLRGVRTADAVALLVVAAALVGTDAHAAAPAPTAAAVGAQRPLSAVAELAPQTVARPATDPAADAGAVAWNVPGSTGVLSANGLTVPLGGRFPALGGGRLAVVAADGTVSVVDRATGAATPIPAAAGADALAVSARWLAWRTPRPDRITVLDLSAAAPAPRGVVTVAAPGTLSRPTLDGDRLAWASATRNGSAIRALDLATPAARAITLRREPRVLLTAPALAGGALLYVRVTDVRQQLLLAAARPGRTGRILLERRGTTGRDGGHDPGFTEQGVRPEDRDGPVTAAADILTATALDPGAAYVTLAPRTGAAPRIVRIAR
jgi:cytochrome c biogenesis protein CcdA